MPYGLYLVIGYPVFEDDKSKGQTKNQSSEKSQKTEGIPLFESNETWLHPNFENSHLTFGKPFSNDSRALIFSLANNSDSEKKKGKNWGSDVFSGAG